MPTYRHIPTGNEREFTVEKWDSIKHQGFYALVLNKPIPKKQKKANKNKG